MNDRRTLWPKWGRHEAFDNMFENTLGQLAPPAYMQSVEVVSFFFYFFLKSKFNNFFILKIGAFFCSAVALECLATMKRTKMKRKNVKKKKQPLHWYFFWYRFSMLFFLKKKEICFNSNYLKKLVIVRLSNIVLNLLPNLKLLKISTLSSQLPRTLTSWMNSKSITEVVKMKRKLKVQHYFVVVF